MTNSSKHSLLKLAATIQRGRPARELGRHPRIAELLAKDSLSRPEDRELSVLSIFPDKKQARGAVLLTSLLLGEPLSSSEETELWQVLSGASRIEELEEKMERTADEESELQAMLSNSSLSVLRGARKLPLAVHVAMAESKALWLQYPEIGACHFEPALAEFEAMVRVFSALGEDSDRRTLDKIAVLNLPHGCETGNDQPRVSFREGRTGITAEETASILTELAREPGRTCIRSDEFAARFCLYVQSGKSWYLRRFAERLLTFVQKDMHNFQRSKMMTFFQASFISDFRKHCLRVRRDYMADLSRMTYGANYGVQTQLMDKVEDGIGSQLARLRLRSLLQQSKRVPSSDVAETLLEEQCAKHVASQIRDRAHLITSVFCSWSETERLDTALKRLENEQGFCAHCAKKLFEDVALERDFFICN